MKNFIRLTPLYTIGDVVIIDADSIVCMKKEFDANNVLIGTQIHMSDGTCEYVCEHIGTVVRLISAANPDCTFVFNKENME